MSIVFIYLILFLFGSVGGYCLEVLFRRFFSAKKWVNPGFLKGPFLPLYGFGIILMFSLTFLCIFFLPTSIHFYNPLGNLFGLNYYCGATVYDLIPISLMCLGMNVLEFIAGIIFVKGFKVKLWDYTNMKGNILGVVCPVFAFIWFGVSVLYYYCFNPFLYQVVLNITEFIYGEGALAASTNLLFILFIGIAYGIFLVDLVKSTNIFAKTRQFMDEKGISRRYEDIKKATELRLHESKVVLAKAVPETIKESFNKKKEKKEPSKFSKWLRKLILIDPNPVVKASDNYDESGRPSKM